MTTAIATPPAAPAAPAKKIVTEAEYLALDTDIRYELVNGELVPMGAGYEHGRIASALSYRLNSLVLQQQLGDVLDSSTTYRMKNGNHRMPDASFVSKERLKNIVNPRKPFNGSPDLAVEILSPSDTIELIHEKIAEYFENGTRLVWSINPFECIALVYHSASPDRLIRGTELLDGEEVLPGFSIALADLFVKPKS